MVKKREERKKVRPPLGLIKAIAVFFSSLLFFQTPRVRHILGDGLMDSTDSTWMFLHEAHLFAAMFLRGNGAGARHNGSKKRPEDTFSASSEALHL